MNTYLDILYTCSNIFVLLSIIGIFTRQEQLDTIFTFLSMVISYIIMLNLLIWTSRYIFGLLWIIPCTLWTYNYFFLLNKRYEEETNW